MQIFFHKEINNPDASIGEQCSMFRTVCSHKVIALGFNTLCYDAERRGIKPSARIKAAYLFVLRNKNSYIRKKNQIFNADL